MHRGMAYGAKGNLDRAIADLDQAIELAAGGHPFASAEEAADYQTYATSLAHWQEWANHGDKAIETWFRLALIGSDEAWERGGEIESYAYARVGYHRGLDALRANGWRGSGYVRWADPTNRGFLGCLRGLGAMATEIGEHDEAERVQQFLLQLDPSREWA